MVLPGFSVRDAIASLQQLSQWLDDRQKKTFFKAWQTIELSDLYRLIVDYYERVGVALFSYPTYGGDKRTVPLYVADGWDRLEGKVFASPNLVNEKSSFSPSKKQLQFWELYRELKICESGLREWPMHDADIFRLTGIEQGEKLQLDFRLGKFPHSVMCQYLLEHEARMTLLESGQADPKSLGLRDAVAKSPKDINSFLQSNIARMGVCNLMLLKNGVGSYLPIVHRRSGLSMAQPELFDVVPTCIFEVATTPPADIELRHTVLREIYEELFGNEQVMLQTQIPNPRFFYTEPGILELIELLEDELAYFDVTGFCIDLVRLVPEITTVFIVSDPKYFKVYGARGFALNPEYRPSSAFDIPVGVGDIDDYLLKIVPENPNNRPIRYGLNPFKWTLGGGFCFRQGLKRAKALGFI